MATSEHEHETGAVACSSKQTQLGEGVRWDARRGEMLGVDILAGRIAPPDRQRRFADLRPRISTALDRRDDRARRGRRWLAARRWARLRLPRARRYHRTIAELSPACPMNDGACDPQGRFWGGTLAEDHREGGGALYRLDRND